MHSAKQDGKAKTMLRESNRARFQTEQTSGSVVVEKDFEEVLFVSRHVILPNKREGHKKSIAYKQSCTFSNQAGILTIIRRH